MTKETQVTTSKNSEKTTEDSTEKVEMVLPGVTRERFEALTKRNQQFLVDLERHLSPIREESEREVLYNEVSQNLLDGQSSGQTARQLYGTPTEMIETLNKIEIEKAEEEAKGPEWLNYMDGALLLGSIFVFITGISMMNPKNNSVEMGIITVFVNYLAAYIASYAIVKYLPNPDAPKGEKGYGKYIFSSILGMLSWYLLITISQTILPVSINPTLSYEYYVIIGIATFALRYYLRRKFKITKSIFN